MKWTATVILWLAIVASAPVRAMFIEPELVTVPTERVLANLTRRLADHPEDGRLHYYLGRLHAMAAVRESQLQVVKTNGLPHLMFDHGVPRRQPAPAGVTGIRPATGWSNSLLHFERAIALLPKSTNTEDAQMVLPAQLGYGWTLQQAGFTNEAVRQYRSTLSLAWARDIGLQVRTLDQTAGWSPEIRRWSGWQTQTLMSGDVLSEEVIRYLLPLLDPKHDAREIEDLKARQTRLAAIPRAITPILIPADPGFRLESLVDSTASVLFDLDGSGIRKRWGWITPQAAWLVWDPEDRREIDSGLKLFGAVTFWVFWRDGYEAMSALDDNDDGVLTGNELHGLALWRDHNADGYSGRDEVTPVSQSGITALECHPLRPVGGTPFHPQGARFGPATRPTFDWSAPSRPGFATQ